MQKAELILTKLYQKSRTNPNYNFKRLYRNLFNPDFFLLSYAKIYSKEGNMTAGIDGEIIDGFNQNKVEKMISKIRKEQYKPTPVKRIYIPKKNGKMRPLGIPTFNDKLLQEVLRLILEAIYEPTFSNSSHGFRPNKSCHTALHLIKTLGTGTTWAIEGDISAFFDTIDHNILIEILKQKIKDGRIIELIKRFLKAGYMNHNIKRNTITGTPQGGIISPILSNIYLNELDKYMEKITLDFQKGKCRRTSNQYSKIRKKYTTLRRKNRIAEAVTIRNQLIKTPYGDPLDPNYRRIQYFRYADDFIILVIGPKSMAMEIKEKISTFLNNKLNIKLNHSKTLITNTLKNKARFLGYQICKAKDDTQLRTNSLGYKMRLVNGRIQLLMPFDVLQTKVKPFRKNNKPIHRPERSNESILEIISHYNSEIRGLYNYYSLCNNVAERIQTFRYFHYFSMAKTIANKEKSSLYKIIKKYGISVKRRDKSGTRNLIGISYTLKDGTKKVLCYFNDPLIKKKVVNRNLKPLSDTFWVHHTNELLNRINKKVCELCHKGIHQNAMEVHHIRKLKDTKKKWKNNCQAPQHVKLMIKMNRKSLVLCKDCHAKIHQYSS